MTFTPGSPLNDGDKPTGEEGLKEIIEERDKRLKQLYDETVYRDSEFKKIQEDRTDTFEAQKALQEDDVSAQEEFDQANKGFKILYEVGKTADKYLGSKGSLGELFDWIKGKSEGKDLPFPTQLLLKEQKDLPLDKTKGLLKEQKDLPSETTVPLDVIEGFPAIQTIYKREGLNPEQKSLLQNIFSKITGKTQEDYVTDPSSANFGALIEDVEEAEGYYGKPPRAFFNKRKLDKRGRLYDLATGEFNVNELGRRYPGKKNRGFRREVQALAVDERFTLTTFVNNRGEILEDWFDGLEAAKDLYDDPDNKNLKFSRDIEAHHIRSIRHMGALFSDMTRSERVRFNKFLFKNAMAVGHNPANIILLSSSKYNDIHGRLHDKLDEKIGIYAEKIIDRNRKYSFSEKVEIAKRMGQIINRYTFEAYEEMADYLDDLMTGADPAAEMAAKIDIAELEARLDFQLDDLSKKINKQGYASLSKQIKTIPGSVSGGYLPYETEDQDVTEGLFTRLTRGKSKKTLERQKRYEELYGKQGTLF